MGSVAGAVVPTVLLGAVVTPGVVCGTVVGSAVPGAAVVGTVGCVVGAGAEPSVNRKQLRITSSTIMPAPTAISSFCCWVKF